MSDAWSALAENRIQEAIRNGEFDGLPGRGQPLDLAEYFKTPAADRVGHAILKNAGVRPPEVELLREISRLENAVAACADGVERRQLQRELQSRRVALALALEQRQRSRRTDVSLEPAFLF